MKVLITGGSGLVGSAIEELVKCCNKYDKYEFVFISSKDCDLTKFDDVRLLFNTIRPNYVIHLAAYVGGLFKNINKKVDMFEQNIFINTNVLKCCHEFNVSKVVSCLSTCIFPDKVSNFIDETMIHDGKPHSSNYGYAYAKRMLDIQSLSYREQYDKNFICVIPTNVYGPNDNYSLDDGHVIPSLIHQCFLAKQNNTEFIIKGTGKPLRQFIYSIDLAKLILWSLFDYDIKENIILSGSDEVSIEDVALKIAKCFDFKDSIVFDESYSDGQFKKTACNEKLIKLYGNLDLTIIEDGIKNSVEWFIQNYDVCRK